MLEQVYKNDDCEIMAHMFEASDAYAKRYFNKHIDRSLFVKMFAKSKTRYGMDNNHTKYFGQSADDTFQSYVTDELQGDLDLLTSKGDDTFKPYELWWIGLMYTNLAYTLQKNFCKVFELIPLETMRHFYVTGHEVSEKQALDNLINYINKA